MLYRLEQRLDKKIFAFTTIALLTLLIYSNSFNAPFNLDDYGSIINNYAIQNPFDIAAIWQFYSNRFVLYFTLSLNYSIHGLSVVGYHITNVTLHILNGILFYLILSNILNLKDFRDMLTAKYKNVICLLGAIIFVCHPVQVNAVTYIIQRTAALASMFYFLSTLLYIKYRNTDKIRYFILTMLCIILAMFTKENTITIPFMLLFLELMFFTKDGKTSWKKRLIIFLILFATLPIIPGTNILFKGFNQSDPDMKFKGSTSMDRFQYFFTELNVIIVYIKQLIIPDYLNFDYSNDFPISKTIWDNYSYISFIILCTIMLTGLMNFKRNKLISLGVLWFFIGLSVESTFISINDVYFEHRLYFPLGGFIICLIGLIFNKSRRTPYKYKLEKPAVFMVISSACLIVMYSGLTLKRNYIFSDGIRLWTDVVKKAPASDRAHCILGTKYLDEYEADKENNSKFLELSELALKKSISINYYNFTSHSNLSKINLLKGEYEKCIDEAKEANSISESKYAYYNLGLAYEKLGRYEKAVNSFLEGYRLDNRCPFILESLGNVYYDINNLKNAKFYFEEYLKNNNYNKKEVEKKLEDINKKFKKSPE